jgi:hypothetical protein
MSALPATLLCLSHKLRIQTGDRRDQPAALACCGLRPPERQQGGADR